MVRTNITLESGLTGQRLLERLQEQAEAQASGHSGDGEPTGDQSRPGLIYFDATAGLTKQVSQDGTFSVPLWGEDSAPLALPANGSAVGMLGLSGTPKTKTLVKTDTTFWRGDMTSMTGDGRFQLPAADDVAGRLYLFRYITENPYWIGVKPPSGGAFVGGYATDEELFLQQAGDFALVYTNGGTEWDILARRAPEWRQVAHDPATNQPGVAHLEDGDPGGGGYDLPTYVRTVFLDATDGDILLNLPDIDGVAELANSVNPVRIVRLDGSGNTVTVDPTSSDAINGGSAGASITLAAYEARTFVAFKPLGVGTTARWATIG